MKQVSPKTRWLCRVQQTFLMSSTGHFLKENKGMGVSFSLAAGCACTGITINFQLFLLEKIDQGIERLVFFAGLESQNVKV